MTYTLGAVHHVAATPVQVAVSNPAGLLVVLSGVPAAVGRRATQPPVLFNVGWINWGDAQGFYQPQRLQLERSIFYPLPDSISTFGIELADSVTADVTELIGRPFAAPYWDTSRGPLGVHLSHYNIYAPHAQIERARYTVPTGRSAIVESLHTFMRRNSAASAVGFSLLAWTHYSITGTAHVMGERRVNAPDTVTYYDENWPPGVTLRAGESIVLQTADTSTGGTVEFYATAKLTEFTP